MKMVFSKYLALALVFFSLAILPGCKASKCDCPNFHGKAPAAQVEAC